MIMSYETKNWKCLRNVKMFWLLFAHSITVLTGSIVEQHLKFLDIFFSWTKGIQISIVCQGEFQCVFTWVTYCYRVLLAKTMAVINWSNCAVLYSQQCSLSLSAEIGFRHENNLWLKWNLLRQLKKERVWVKSSDCLFVLIQYCLLLNELV